MRQVPPLGVRARPSRGCRRPPIDGVVDGPSHPAIFEREMVEVRPLVYLPWLTLVGLKLLCPRAEACVHARQCVITDGSCSCSSKLLRLPCEKLLQQS